MHVILQRVGCKLRIVPCSGQSITPTGKILSGAVPLKARKQLPKLLSEFVAAMHAPIHPIVESEESESEAAAPAVPSGQFYE
jgi:hypothetical protein